MLICSCTFYLYNLDHEHKGEGKRGDDEDDRDEGKDHGADPWPLVTEVNIWRKH